MTATTLEATTDLDYNAISPAPAPNSAPPNPALIGLPTFIVGAIALGLVLVGYVPAAAAGACILIIMTATGLGQTIAATWAARLGQGAVASIFAIFAGFWISYAALVLGLTNDWFGIVAEDAVGVQKLFLLSWLVAIVLLTLATLRLPLAFTVLFVLVDIALTLVFLGTANASTTLLHAGGYAVFAFALVGTYLFFDAMGTATGGKAFPQGRALLG